MAPLPEKQFLHEDNAAEIFKPLKFRSSLKEIKNRLLRSNISGQFDEYNGHGGNARLNWEESFAKGGVGAIISSFTPVTPHGRILTRYAMIDDDNKIPFWTEVGKRVHKHDCKFILQLSHSGRQQDVGGVENLFRKAPSSTNKMDYFHGILAKAMTIEEIHQTVEQFAQGARRAKAAGLDGVELHGANGYLITQFLSSGINDRKDEFGGSVENRARFVLEIVRAIRREVGPDFHLQMKINGVDHNSWLYPWIKKGNTLDETLKICKILMDDKKGVDAFHISSGSTFPHPRNPPGSLSKHALARWYPVMISKGANAWFNYLNFVNPLNSRLFIRYWIYRRGPIIEGINLEYSRFLRREIHKIDPTIPVLCTGGFQHASNIAQAIRSGDCDAVAIARPLIANPDLPKILESGDGPLDGKECTYCNKCLINDLENPLACYEVSRFDGATFEEKWDNVIKEAMKVFEPPTFPG